MFLPFCKQVLPCFRTENYPEQLLQKMLPSLPVVVISHHAPAQISLLLGCNLTAQAPLLWSSCWAAAADLRPSWTAGCLSVHEPAMGYNAQESLLLVCCSCHKRTTSGGQSFTAAATAAAGFPGLEDRKGVLQSWMRQAGRPGGGISRICLHCCGCSCLWYVQGARKW